MCSRCIYNPSSQNQRRKDAEGGRSRSASPFVVGPGLATMPASPKRTTEKGGRKSKAVRREEKRVQEEEERREASARSTPVPARARRDDPHSASLPIRPSSSLFYFDTTPLKPPPHKGVPAYANPFDTSIVAAPAITSLIKDGLTLPDHVELDTWGTEDADVTAVRGPAFKMPKLGADGEALPIELDSDGEPVQSSDDEAGSSEEDDMDGIEFLDGHPEAPNKRAAPR